MFACVLTWIFYKLPVASLKLEIFHQFHFLQVDYLTNQIVISVFLIFLLISHAVHFEFYLKQY